MAKHQIRVKINGSEHKAEVESRLLLVHFLREDAEHDRHAHRLRHHPLRRLHRAARRRSRSSRARCCRPGRWPRGETVEGLEQGGKLASVQKGFWQEHGLQCGYCTPGMMMTSFALLPAESRSQRSGDPPGDLRQSLPLHRLRQHRQGHAVCGGRHARARRNEPARNICA